MPNRSGSPRRLGAAVAAGMDRVATQVPAEPELIAAPRVRHWHRVAQALLIVMMIGTTAGVLGIVVQNSILLGRMTTDVSIAQQRATNLHTLQLETLHVLQKLTELDNGGDVETVEIRRGVWTRMITVVRRMFPASSQQGIELREIQTAFGRFSWAKLAGPERPAVLGVAKNLVSGAEIRIRQMYDEQEKFFYEATLHSLAAKRDSQNALVVLVSLVVLMAISWLVLLRRRTRSRLVRAYDALLSEVSERRTLQDKLSHQAFHDALTGLPNRALFLQELEDSMRDSGRTVSVALVDLDGFKNINDTLGHSAGDELLQRTAERLRTCVRATDLVARLGGDEFAIVVRSDALTVARRVIETLSTPVKVARQEISINASIGIAHLDDQATADDLLSDADIAMYAAKKGGKARYEVFQRDMRDQTLHRVRLEQQLARAVELGEIQVHYQPIIDVRTGRATAVEALSRWQHPEDGMIPPAAFIPIAEESGLIREIGREVLRRACRTVQQWRRSVPGCEQLAVTVNVSVRQLLSGAFADHVHEALRASGLPASGLTLEITETMLLEQSDAVSAELARIRSLGVRLAMDDFGAGYSSVASLLRMQVNVLKIDKTFLDLDSHNRGTLLRAITDLGHTLGLTVVAEGVETAEQLAHVRAANCDAAQGFLLSRPLPEDAVRAYLDTATAPELAPV